MARIRSIKTAGLLLLAALLAVPLTWSADEAGGKPKPYPLDHCVISGEKLGGDMGQPYVIIYGKSKDNPGREIKFCCKSCLKKADLDKISAMLDEMEATNSPALVSLRTNTPPKEPLHQTLPMRDSSQNTVK